MRILTRNTTRSTLVAAAVAVAAALGGAPGPLTAAAGGAPTPAQPAVTVAELPALGGVTAIPFDIDSNGAVVGTAATASGDMHPVLWAFGQALDLAPTLPPGATGSAQGIGANGRIVGLLSQPRLIGGGPGVVTWYGGLMTTLSAPPTAGDEPVAINGNHQILYRDGGRSFLWSNGTTTPAPEVAPGVPLDVADINEWGLVAGTSAPDDDDQRRATVWLPGLPPVELGTLGGSWSEALAVNELGQVVGRSETAAGETRMFITQGWDLVDLGHLGGGESDYQGGFGLAPRLVNDLGHVVGTSTTAAGDRHAFLWRNGTMTDLGTLGPAEPVLSAATALNDRGQVVGLSTGGEAIEADAVAWQDGSVIDLGGLTGADDRFISVAYAINEQGQAIGQTISNVSGTRGWLWTVPR